MIRFKTLIVLLALCVVAPACRVSVAETTVAPTDFRVFPTVVPVEPFENQVGIESRQEPADGQEELSANEGPLSATQQFDDEVQNEGAAFDQFVMDRFPNAARADFGIIQTVVSAYCLRVVTSETIGLLPIDGPTQREVLSIDDATCESMEMSDLLIRAEPVDAATWEEAVTRRFARTVWWYSEDRFAARAEQVCETRPTRMGLGEDTSLSLSVSIELSVLVEHGDCDLRQGGAAAAVAAASDIGALENGPLDDELTVYTVQFNPEDESGRRSKDLYAIDVQTGDQTRLTDTRAESRHGGVGYTVALSPDGRRLAYKIGESFDTVGLYVSELDGSGAVRVGEIPDITDLAWSPDGTEIIFNAVEGEARVIAAMNIADGSQRVVYRPFGDDAWLIGVSGDDVVQTDTDGWNHSIVRVNLSTGLVWDQIPVDYGRYNMAADGSAIVVSFTYSGRDDGDLGIIDLGGEMQIEILPNAPGIEAAPTISPDGRWVKFGVGPQFNANELFVTELASPDERFNITPRITDDGRLGRSLWTPDSRGVLFSYGPDLDSQLLWLMTLDGDVTISDIEITGTPVLLIPGKV